MAEQIDPKSCSVSQAADCIGIYRNTLAKWLEEQGALFIERAEGNKA